MQALKVVVILIPFFRFVDSKCVSWGSFNLSRQSSVDDLVKLARQFDENMQQDRETSEAPNPANPDERGNTSKTELRETSIPSNVKEIKCPSSLDHVETELHALFDSSTQKISGRISQVSLPSTCSQKAKDQPVTSNSVEPGQTELKSANKSGPTAQPAEGKNSLSGNNCDDFDDDWVNDDLINDPILLAITQDPHQHYAITPKATMQSDMKTNTTHFSSACKSDLHSKPSCSTLKELCPKPKTSNRSTFKLGSNPHFQPTPAASYTCSKMGEQKPATKALSTPQPDKITNDQRETRVAADSANDFSDSLWDDRDEDELLYQVCDSMERISNTQQQQVSPGDHQIIQSTTVDRQGKTTKPLPIDTVRSTTTSSRANRQSPRAWVHSNSLPVTSCEVANYQGWNIPVKGANNKSQMSQSLPGSQVGLGAFRQSRDPSGAFQIGNDNADKDASTVTARAPSKSPHRALKRNLPDSADKSNKGRHSEYSVVTVPGQAGLTATFKPEVKLNLNVQRHDFCFVSVGL